MITKEELLEKIEKNTCIFNRCYTVRNIIKCYDNVVIHDDIKTQEHIAKIFDKIDEDIKKEEKLLKKYQDFKKYHLGKMFV